MAEIKLKTDLSKLSGQEQIKKVNENTAKKYRVVEETIDLASLRAEKTRLELELVKPTEDELVSLGQSQHPFYYAKEDNEARIAEIDSILAKANG